MFYSKINNLKMRVPKNFEGILPVSPRFKDFQYEIETFNGLKRVIKQNSIVFDIGCNFGVTTTMIGILMKRKGSIHAFDGNEYVFKLAKELTLCNKIKNITWNHILIGEDVKNDIPFYSIPALHSVASTRNSEITKFENDASLQYLSMMTIDEYCSNNNVSPDCIKIDIEGSEFAALLGAKELLKSKRPSLILETHGLELIGILGSVEEMFEFLQKIGYNFIDLHTNQEIRMNDIISRYSTIIGHILAY